MGPERPARGEVCLTIREWSGTSIAASARTCVTATSGWARIPELAYTAAASGRKLDLSISQTNARSGDSFEVDGVTLYAGLSIRQQRRVLKNRADPVMRVVVGALGLVCGLVLVLLGALWALLKTAGGEWDYCPDGRECISGYYPAAGFLLAGVVIASLGLRLLRTRGSPRASPWRGGRR